MANLTATAADLPPAVAAALAGASADLAGARRAIVPDGGYEWSTVAWGDPSDPPVVLVHGVTSNSDAFWRVGPALAAAGRHVVAVDLPGHGRTGGWLGHHRFLETASELADMLRTAGLDRPDLSVLGHSWGAMVVAALPAAGLRPDRLILLDPPALSAAIMEMLTHDPLERRYDSLDEAQAAIGGANPQWIYGDVRAKALGLTQFDVGGVLAILSGNGDWDAGLAALSDPAAATVTIWMIRGAPEAGGMVPDAVLPSFRARVGADQVITIADAPHSPQRMYPEATVLAILIALGEAKAQA